MKGHYIAAIVLMCVLWSVIPVSAFAQAAGSPSPAPKGADSGTPPQVQQAPTKELFLSLGSGDLEYFRKLLDAGANPNAATPGTGKTLLMAAERAELLALLLKFGADPGLVDHRGATALHYAVATADALRMIPLLLEKGVPVNAKAKGLSHQTPFMVASKLYLQGRGQVKSAKVMQLLAKHGAEVNAVDDSGYTVLINAVVNDKPDLVRMMIEMGADLKIKAKDGLSALDWAQELGFVDIVEMLETALQ